MYFFSQRSSDANDAREKVIVFDKSREMDLKREEQNNCSDMHSQHDLQLICVTKFLFIAFFVNQSFFTMYAKVLNYFNNKISSVK